MGLTPLRRHSYYSGFGMTGFLTTFKAILENDWLSDSLIKLMAYQTFKVWRPFFILGRSIVTVWPPGIAGNRKAPAFRDRLKIFACFVYFPPSLNFGATSAVHLSRPSADLFFPFNPHLS
jgi:hypothetical protein